MAMDDRGRGRSLVVWLAGVTGYWLVWDERAQALNEATIAVVGGWERCRHVLRPRRRTDPGAGTGWGVLFALWLAHLLLTVVIGYAIWRHVRRTRLAVLPPRHWMVIMFGALVLASIALPADLLRPADPSSFVGDLPLDPFVLFLLPPMLVGVGLDRGVRGARVVIAAVLVRAPRRAPSPGRGRDRRRSVHGVRAVRRRLPVSTQCPWLAHSDADGVVGTHPLRPIAVVDADACVGCGICVGLVLVRRDPLAGVRWAASRSIQQASTSSWRARGISMPPR